jgi:hypothetical protein
MHKKIAAAAVLVSAGLLAASLLGQRAVTAQTSSQPVQVTFASNPYTDQPGGTVIDNTPIYTGSVLHTYRVWNTTAALTLKVRVDGTLYQIPHGCSADLEGRSIVADFDDTRGTAQYVRVE